MPGRRQATLRLQRSLDAPARARERVEGLCQELEPRLRDEALLLTSELVTNAVLHGEGLVTVAIDCAEHVVAVAVGDSAPEQPSVVPPSGVSRDSEGGRGLQLVNAIASEWGVRNQRDGGKVVWFRLA